MVVMHKSLKLLNFFITLAGTTMMYYAWAMYKLWHPDMPLQPFQLVSLASRPVILGYSSSKQDLHWDRIEDNMTMPTQSVPTPLVSKEPGPWFILAVLAAGIVTCLTSSVGHIAAETSSAKLLASYAAALGMLVILETIVAGVIVFNVHWHDDMPFDATGELDTLEAFVDDHFQLCKTVAWGFLAVEGQCIFLALRLLVDGDDSRESEIHDSTDSESTTRMASLEEPLVRNVGQHSSQGMVAAASSSSAPWGSPDISLSTKAMSHDDDAQHWRLLKQKATDSNVGHKIQSELDIPSLPSGSLLPKYHLGPLTVDKKSCSKGKAVTSSSKSLSLWGDREEGSSLSGISWTDLFVDAGDEDSPSVGYEDYEEDSGEGDDLTDEDGSPHDDCHV